MKNLISKYSIELLIVLVSLMAGLIEIVIVQDDNIAAVIVMLGFLLSLASIAIRQEIVEQIATQLELRRIVQSISSEHWRVDAEGEVEELKLKLRQWAEGSRNIPVGESIPYQIDIVRKTRREIRAIHVGVSKDHFEIWSNQSRAFSRLADALRQVDSKTRKRRLFILDKDAILTDDGKIESEEVRCVFQKQVQPVDQGGQGTDVRILWACILRDANSPIPPDLLIADNREVILVKGRGSLYLTIEACTNETTVKSYQRLFDSYWKMAEPVTEYLQSGKAD